MPSDIIDISQIRLDDDNANRGRESGNELLEKSIRENGPGRGIFLDADLRAIAGNKTLEAARRAGIRKVRIVRAASDELVATVRPDIRLNTPEGRQMALDDNGIAHANLNFDPAVVMRQVDEFGLDLEDAGITPEVMAQIAAAAAEGAAGGGTPVAFENEPAPDDEQSIAAAEGAAADISDRFTVVVECRDVDEQREVYEQLTEEGRRCRVITS